MTEYQFIDSILSNFGACTSVDETYTSEELLEDYREWRAGHRKGSPLTTDNRLSRQAYLNYLLQMETLFWEREHGSYASLPDHRAFIREITNNVIKLKVDVRAA
jgi:hypothetical protein